MPAALIQLAIAVAGPLLDKVNIKLDNKGWNTFQRFLLVGHHAFSDTPDDAKQELRRSESKVQANYQSTDQPVPFVYGTRRVGGMDAIPGFTSGSYGEHLHRAMIVSIGRVDGFADTYLNEARIPSSAYVSMANSGYNNTYRVQSHSQLSSKSLYSYTNCQFLVGWNLGTTSHGLDKQLTELNSRFQYFRGHGLAWAAMRYTLNTGHDNYEELPTMNFLVRGICCYDPRLDSTRAGGSGTHRFNDSTTWAHTDNPILCTVHHLTHPMAGDFDEDEIEWPKAMAAADICDALVVTPTGTQKRYTCNGVVFAPLTPADFANNITNLIASCLGRVIYTNGVWELYAGAFPTPTRTIYKQDWITPPSIRLEGGDKARFNYVLGWYNPVSKDYQRASIARTNSAYQVADGGLVPKEIELTMCTDDNEAQRRIELTLRQSRNQQMIDGDLPPRLTDIGMAEIVSHVNTAIGWTSKTMRLISDTVIHDGSMAATFQEEQSSDWTDLTTAEYTSNFSSYQLPTQNALIPQEPSNFAVTPQINGTLLFDIAPGFVSPLGTVHRIIRSTNSSDASVGTVVWEGDARRVALVMPTSPHWYYAQSRVGSVFSPYSPNTYGVSGQAQKIVKTFVSETNSVGLITGDFFNVTTFTPPYRGELISTAVAEGSATFDSDGGTSVIMALCYASDVTSSASGKWTANSVYAYGPNASMPSTRGNVSMSYIFSINTVTPMVLGFQGFKAFGSLAINRSVLSSRLVGNE